MFSCLNVHLKCTIPTKLKKIILLDIILKKNLYENSNIYWFHIYLIFTILNFTYAYVCKIITLKNV